MGCSHRMPFVQNVLFTEGNRRRSEHLTPALSAKPSRELLPENQLQHRSDHSCAGPNQNNYSSSDMSTSESDPEPPSSETSPSSILSDPSLSSPSSSAIALSCGEKRNGTSARRHLGRGGGDPLCDGPGTGPGDGARTDQQAGPLCLLASLLSRFRQLGSSPLPRPPRPAGPGSVPCRPPGEPMLPPAPGGHAAPGSPDEARCAPRSPGKATTARLATPGRTSGTPRGRAAVPGASASAAGPSWAWTAAWRRRRGGRGPRPTEGGCGPCW